MRVVFVLMVLAVALGAAAEEDIPKAEPLLDLEAVQPQDEAQPVEWVRPVRAPEIGLPQRVISDSRQFGVTGGDGPQRGSVAIMADSIRRRFYRLLGREEPPAPGFPIEIELHGKPGDPPRKRPLAYELRFTADAFLLRIHVDLSRGVDLHRLERAVLSGLLYQQALKDEPPGPRESPLKAPVWLIEGLREAEAWRSGRGDRLLYEGVFEQDLWFTLEEIFAMSEKAHSELDGASRMAFRVLSGALTMALLEQPNGQRAFAALCGEVAAFEGEMPILLRRHFPDLNLSERSLAKWWTLTLAKLADAPLTEVLGILATEESLEEGLAIHFRTDEGLARSEAFANAGQLERIPLADRAAAIRPAQDALNRLSYRCFPSYRPLLLDYQRLLQDWARGETDGEFADTMAELEETRTLMAGRALRARDYMDYMEISGTVELSGGFDSYMELIRALKEQPRVEREDPFTRYLDDFERLYQGGDKRN